MNRNEKKKILKDLNKSIKRYERQRVWSLCSKYDAIVESEMLNGIDTLCGRLMYNNPNHFTNTEYSSGDLYRDPDCYEASLNVAKSLAKEVKAELRNRGR